MSEVRIVFSLGRIVPWSSIGIALLAGGVGNAAELFGKVIDAIGQPLPDTTVELRKAGDPKIIGTAHTDRSGAFRFSGLGEGGYQVKFLCLGFHVAEIHRDVTNRTDVAIPDVTLQVAPVEKCPDPDFGPPGFIFTAAAGAAELSGAVATQGSAPVRDAIVVLSNRERGYRTQSLGSGEFGFSDMVPGVYDLRVQHDGFADFVVERVEIRENTKTHISDRLILQRCPANIPCQPVRNTLRVRVCL